MLGVLGRRITKGLRLPSYYPWVVASVVGLFALLAVVASSCVLLSLAADSPSTESASFHPSAVAWSSLIEAPIAAEKGPLDNHLDNDGQVDCMTNSQLACGKPVRGELDNDLDNDGHPDGMANPLFGLGLGYPGGMADPLVGLGLVFLLIPSVGGSLFLLSLYKLPMVGCDYYPPLERPG